MQPKITTLVKKLTMFNSLIKINIILVIIVFFTSIFMNAQNSTEITGLYSLGSYSPEGGSHLFILQDGNYAITYFGGIQTGNWQKTKNNSITFLPHIKESKFELFGRHNKDLKGSTKILFRGFQKGETFIQLTADEKETTKLRRVFNQDANCFSSPYVYTFKTLANNISFMATEYGNSYNDIITIENPEMYNDFIAKFIAVNYVEAETLFAKFKDQKLYFENDKTTQRIPLQEVNSEDIEFITNFISSQSNTDTIYLNPSYNTFGGLESEEQQDIHKYHVFNKEKNAFIDEEYYVEGVEYKNTDESYDDMSIIYAYNALKKHSKKSGEYKINEKSLFQVNCD